MLAVALVALPALAAAAHPVLRAHVRDAAERQAVLETVDDVWGGGADFIDFLPKGSEALRLVERDIKLSTVVPDIDALIASQREQQRQWAQPDAPGADWFSEYHPLAEIDSYVAGVAAANPIVQGVRLANASYEGRDQVGYVVSDQPVGAKPAILVIATQHAREWITPAATLYAMDSIIAQYASSPAISQYEWHVLPMINPDGYEYTWGDEFRARMWRKTRGGVNGQGVDANRNWETPEWCTSGASQNPSSDTFCGEAPFSEPETASVRDYIAANIAQLVAFVDVHSYSQLVLRQYAWTREAHPDEPQNKVIGDIIGAAMTDAVGNRYTSQLWIDLYPATGVATDSTPMTSNGATTFTLELQDLGRYGFVLPPELIVPNGLEVEAGLLALVETL